MPDVDDTPELADFTNTILADLVCTIPGERWPAFLTACTALFRLYGGQRIDWDTLDRLFRELIADARRPTASTHAVRSALPTRSRSDRGSRRR